MRCSSDACHVAPACAAPRAARAVCEALVTDAARSMRLRFLVLSAGAIQELAPRSHSFVLTRNATVAESARAVAAQGR